MARHVVVDTGPIVAALIESGPRTTLARHVIGRLSRAAVIADPVAVETDTMLRRRPARAVVVARTFWAALDKGIHRRMPMTQDLWLRAAAIDAQFADLDLGAVDAAVAAVAEALDAPIFTWDFRDFGPVAAALSLELLVEESDLA